MTVVPEPAGPVPWWREAVCYEIHPRAFADGNGDGTGDLPGATARLDHLAQLGVDAVWITPFYPSPLADGGYDIAERVSQVRILRQAKAPNRSRRVASASSPKLRAHLALVIRSVP